MFHVPWNLLHVAPCNSFQSFLKCLGLVVFVDSFDRNREIKKQGESYSTYRHVSLVQIYVRDTTKQFDSLIYLLQNGHWRGHGVPIVLGERKADARQERQHLATHKFAWNRWHSRITLSNNLAHQWKTLVSVIAQLFKSSSASKLFPLNRNLSNAERAIYFARRNFVMK